MSGTKFCNGLNLPPNLVDELSEIREYKILDEAKAVALARKEAQ